MWISRGFRFALPLLTLILLTTAVLTADTPLLQDAPVGLDNLTNGLVDQATHDADSGQFAEQEDAATAGVGPVFNDTACAACHLNGGAVGAGSQVQELRVGYFRNGVFQNPDITLPSGEVVRGRSLVNHRAICPEAQEHVPEDVNVRTGRLSLPVLGDGYIEALDDADILANRDAQCQASGGAICGLAVQVPILEAPGQTGVGRFGWKAQHRSLLSFSADAYLNEMGITNQLAATEVATTCNPSTVTQPNNVEDIETFAQFMRATKAPGPDAALLSRPIAIAGARIFVRIGCETCHTATWTTAPAGTVVNGGQLTVPPALARKTIHPFSDFLLHDVGTGDGIVQNGGPESRLKIRTPPLWGLRLRVMLLHDGRAQTLTQAILRHQGEGALQAIRFVFLTPGDQRALLEFLRSL